MMKMTGRNIRRLTAWRYRYARATGTMPNVYWHSIMMSEGLHFPVSGPFELRLTRREVRL